MNIIKKSNQPGVKSETSRPAVKKDDVDIFSMLEQAQMNFVSTPNQPPAQSQQQQHQKVQQQQIQQMFNKLQPKPQVINASAPDITAPNVASFFAAAQKPNPPNNIEMTRHKPQPIVNKNACPTVDEIEKLHRQISISPKPSVQQTQKVPVVINNPTIRELMMKMMIPNKHFKFLPFSVQSRADMKPKGPTLVTPNMLKAPTQQQKPLYPQQLVQALQYLLDNDPEFTRKIHETYIKNFHNSSH